MKIIGHRGALGLAPENSRAAIVAGIQAGADMIEFDVRVTRDGVPVLAHDARLRPSAGRGHGTLVRSADWVDLRRDHPQLITLAEALEAIGSSAVPMAELKAGEPAAPVAAVIRQHLHSTGAASDSLMIGSKSFRTLHDLHKLLPKVPTVVIDPWSGVRAARRARQLGTPYISMRSWWLWRGFLRGMARRGFKLFVYTLNNPARIRRWQPYLHGVITDYPDRFK